MSRDILPAGYNLHWYTIDSVLGRGAFGVTYMAHDQNLDQMVAIKEYFPNQFSSRVTGFTVQPVTGEQKEMYEWGLDRFIKEARTLAKFKHHNIVRVFSVFEHNNTAYMVMEYEQGQELTQVYKSMGSLTEQQLLSIYLPISSGLKLIHDAGFIHRDIKPANIYIRTSDHSPVLLDFGSARKVTKSQTQALTSLVTPGYAPFEQFNEGDEKQGPWTDIYALGASLYYGVTGRLPIDSMARGSSLLSSGTDTYVPVAVAAEGDYSNGFLNAIDAALTFNSHQRPQNIVIWADMLNSGSRQTTATAAQTKTLADDGESTIMTPRTRNANAPKVDYSEKTGYVQTLKMAFSANGRPVWQQQAYIWLGAGVLSVAVLLTAMQFLFSNESDNRLEIDTVKSDKTLPEKTNIKDSFKISPNDHTIQIEAKVKAFLANANEASKQGNFFEPAQQNAVYYYQQIQKIDVSNQTAPLAIEGIVSQYSDEILADIRTGSLKQASRKISMLQAALPEDSSIAELQQEIEIVTTKSDNKAQDIATWLQQAKKLLAKGRRSQPKKNNALTYYRRVLAIDANNEEAVQGLDNISQYYIKRAKQNLKSRRLSKFARDLKLAATANSKAPALPGLQKKLKQQRKKVSALLKLAKQAYRADKLTQPAKKNALYYYQRVSKYDKTNSKAKKGIQLVIKRISTLFENHVKSGKYTAAESVLTSFERALPESKTAKKLRNAFSLDGANPNSDISMANKMIGNFKRYFEARDVKSLNNMLVYRKGLSSFLHDFFSNYNSFKLGFSNIKYISKKRAASADVKISNLSNKNGMAIQAGAWSKFRIVSKRNKHGRWKIFWENSDLK